MNYLPPLDAGMTLDMRRSFKDEVARRIEEELNKDEDYLKPGGLAPLVGKVALETGWPRSDVYNALRAVDGVGFNLADQTIFRVKKHVA